MTAKEYLRRYAYYYLYAIALTLLLAYGMDHSVRQVSAAVAEPVRPVIIIDAGHGGIDGGTTSCTGVLESTLNLQISNRLNALCRLLGYETLMTRTTADALSTEGDTIRAQKVSDLKNRVSIVNSSKNSILLSIHQNFYPQSQYYGPQVFYNSDAKDLAAHMQNCLNQLTSELNRSSKLSTGVYLMEHIQKPGLLVECGFLSNPQEEAKLRSEEYQKKLCAVIATGIAQYIESSLVS